MLSNGSASKIPIFDQFSQNAWIIRKSGCMAFIEHQHCMAIQLITAFLLVVERILKKREIESALKQFPLLSFAQSNMFQCIAM